jgi:hypothetical protein
MALPAGNAKDAQITRAQLRSRVLPSRRPGRNTRPVIA